MKISEVLPNLEEEIRFFNLRLTYEIKQGVNIIKFLSMWTGELSRSQLLTTLLVCLYKHGGLELFRWLVWIFSFDKFDSFFILQGFFYTCESETTKLTECKRVVDQCSCEDILKIKTFIVFTRVNLSFLSTIETVLLDVKILGQLIFL